MFCLCSVSDLRILHIQGFYKNLHIWGFYIFHIYGDSRWIWGVQFVEKSKFIVAMFHLHSLWYEDANARSHGGYEGKCGEVDDAEKKEDDAEE